MKIDTKNISHTDMMKIISALRLITHSLDCQSKKCLKETGLSTAQIVLLSSISKMSQATTRHIAKSVSLSPATVNVMIDRLVDKGLVTRQRSETDRRIVYSHLTALGKEALKAAPSLLPASFTQILADKPPSEQTQIIGSLSDLAEIFSSSESAPLSAPKPLVAAL